MIQLTSENLFGLIMWFLDPEAAPPMGVPQDRAQVARWCLDQLFLRAPPFVLNDDKVRAYEAIIDEQFHRSPVQQVRYACRYPKYDFLRYLVHSKGYLLHGSASGDIEQLEPSEQTDWSGKRITAVFATGDGIWPMFFALLDRSSLRGSIRNGCFVVEASPQDSERFYFFSVNAEALAAGVWTEGTVHVLPRDTFEPTSRGPVRFDEWASEDKVPIAAQVPVSPADFPFLENVTGHREQEPVTETWLRFRERQRAS